jgi:tyrocidine synthetase-3
LALRNQPEGEKSFRCLLAEIKEEVIKALENQDYPFDQLVTKLGLQGNTSRNPLFNVVFAMQNMEIDEIQNNNLNIFYHPQHENKISRFDLTLFAEESGERLKIGLEFSTQLFKQSSAVKILHHYTEILNRVVEHPEIKLKDILLSHNLLVADSRTRQQEQMNFGF